MSLLDCKLCLVIFWWLAWHQLARGAPRTGLLISGTTVRPGFHFKKGIERILCPADHPYAYNRAKHCCSEPYWATDPSKPLDIYDPQESCSSTNQIKCPGKDNLCKSSQKVPLWSKWAETGFCSVSCGSGTKQRTRSCEPQGNTCPGPSSETVSCNEGVCPVYGAILIAGGNDGSTIIHNAELISLDDTIITCDPVPDLPATLDTKYGISFKHNEDPVFCAGLDGSPCFKYSPSTNAWESFTQLLTTRKAAAVMDLGDYILVTGGRADSTFYSTTELWDPVGEEFTSGPSLLAATSCHCAAAINRTHGFLAGGYTNSDWYMDTAYLFNREEEEWTQLPSMSYTRHYHACGLAGSSKMIVAGGAHSSTYRLQVEFLDLLTLTWSQGQDLQQFWAAGATVPLDDTLLLVGGVTDAITLDTVFEYDVGNDNWILRTQRLGINRQGLPAFYKLTSSYFNCGAV